MCDLLPCIAVYGSACHIASHISDGICKHGLELCAAYVHLSHGQQNGRCNHRDDECHVHTVGLQGYRRAKHQHEADEDERKRFER